MRALALIPRAAGVMQRLPWPLPALLAWAAAWALYAGGTHGMGWAAPWALLLATAWVAVAGVGAATPWRRVFIALGFPLSLLASGALAGVPAWAWLLPMVLLVALYPVRSWRDAPLFPTPAGALEGLLEAAPLWRGARVLDAGCGLGDGLRELQRVYPQARLTGLEWSWPLGLACAWRVPHARVRRGDLWAEDWSSYDLVYLFQRPESMRRAAAKAAREMRPGAWLVSLEFPIPDAKPVRVLQCAGGRRVWLYRLGTARRAARAVPQARSAEANVRALCSKSFR
jgi:hypothetical protein